MKIKKEYTDLLILVIKCWLNLIFEISKTIDIVDPTPFKTNNTIIVIKWKINLLNRLLEM